MKYFLIIPVILLCAQLSNAQFLERSLLSTSGDTFERENVSLTWSLGEIATETLVGEGYTLTQGFHQTYTTINSVNSKFTDQLCTIDIYPNPVKHKLYLNIKSPIEHKADYSLRVFNAIGKIILIEEFFVNAYSIKVSDYPEGFYIISFTDKTHNETQSFKFQIIK